MLFYPTPININYFWNFGFMSSVFLVTQIISGFFLCFYFTNDILLAFDSVEYLMTEVPFGWFIRYFHANGASFFFIVLYIHMFRGIYFKSYRSPRLLLWLSGVLLFLLTMGTAFLGYVLPWGQMSFWGATVISNFLGGIPLIGETLLNWLWGGYSISNSTLHRIFALHYLLPLLISGLSLFHLSLLHKVGSSNPLNVLENIYLPLFPYFFIKDLFGLLIIYNFFFIIIYYYPNLLGHSDNYMMADSGVTPEHIVPEWYFLPYYAILRSIPNKNLGILLMLFSILSLCFLSLLSSLYKKLYVTNLIYFYKLSAWSFYCVFIFLGWIGSQPAEYMCIQWGKLLTFLYFMFLGFFILENVVVNFFLKNNYN